MFFKVFLNINNKSERFPEKETLHDQIQKMDDIFAFGPVKSNAKNRADQEPERVMVLSTEKWPIQPIEKWLTKSYRKPPFSRCRFAGISMVEQH